MDLDLTWNWGKHKSINKHISREDIQKIPFQLKPSIDSEMPGTDINAETRDFYELELLVEAIKRLRILGSLGRKVSLTEGGS